MLVLSRKKNEEIVLGDDVVVKVLAIRGDRITLGIAAPGSYRIWRGELPPRPAGEVQEREGKPE